MPFLRFSRDKRGYETTALVHAFRRQGRSNARILYWFRTPVDTRVGRAALDEDAIRLLEEHHPGLTFDWPKILQVNAAAGPEESVGHSGRAVDRRRGERRRERREAPGASERRFAGGARASEGLPPNGPATPPEPEPELSVAELSAEPETSSEAEPVREPVVSSAQSAFSPEDLARLRGRHAALLARINEEVSDVEKAEGLRSRAEALNPDTWVTPEDVRDALERYEQVYRELREALGRRKRRHRRRPSGDHEPPQVV